MSTLEALEMIERKIEEAAGALVPVMTGTTSDPVEIAKAVHDALNHLAAARLRAGLEADTLEVAPARTSRRTATPLTRRWPRSTPTTATPRT